MVVDTLVKRPGVRCASFGGLSLQHPGISLELGSEVMLLPHQHMLGIKGRGGVATVVWNLQHERLRCDEGTPRQPSPARKSPPQRRAAFSLRPNPLRWEQKGMSCTGPSVQARQARLSCAQCGTTRPLRRADEAVSIMLLWQPLRGTVAKLWIHGKCDSASCSNSTVD